MAVRSFLREKKNTGDQEFLIYLIKNVIFEKNDANGSCECSKSELNVLSVPPTMTAMQESQWVEHFPIASLTNNAPIEFVIPPQTNIGQIYHNRICMSNSKSSKPMVML